MSFATPSLYAWDLLFLRKFAHVHLKASQAFNSSGLRAHSNLISNKSSRICGPIKIPPFNFAAITFGNFVEGYWNPCELTLPIALIKFFIKPSLMWRGGRKIFWGSIKGKHWILLVPGTYVDLSAHSHLL